jgi:transposase
VGENQSEEVAINSYCGPSTETPADRLERGSGRQRWRRMVSRRRILASSLGTQRMSESHRRQSLAGPTWHAGLSGCCEPDALLRSSAL